MEVTKQLAQFVVNHSYSNISADIRELAKLTIIDSLGCCIAGYTEAKEECEWIIDLINCFSELTQIFELKGITQPHSQKVDVKDRVVAVSFVVYKIITEY